MSVQASSDGIRFVSGHDFRSRRKTIPPKSVILSAVFARRTSRDASDSLAAGVAPSRQIWSFWPKNRTSSIHLLNIGGGPSANNGPQDDTFRKFQSGTMRFARNAIGNRLISVLSIVLLLLSTSTAAYAQTPAPEVHVRVHPHPQVHVNDFEDSEMTVTEQETINKSFPFPATGQRRSVDVDNVWGFVHVTGGLSDQVQLVAKKTIRAESKDKLELAKKEVTLDIGQQGNTLTFYVNGPFRCHCDCCSNCREHQGYIVKYDFELQVPRDTDLTARTVNDGDVIVQNVAGQYSVHNVNGPVEMRDVAGSGDAKTVNGELKVLFRGNPQSNSSFASLNGDVDLYFLPKLSADLRFKTFNGAVFSDFEMAALPQRQPVEEHQNGKFIFRADRYAGGRVAAGGPEIKVETLNGDIHIRERHD